MAAKHIVNITDGHDPRPNAIQHPIAANTEIHIKHILTGIIPTTNSNLKI
jgi:hypothetical protein